jgi:hypothetical protein
MSGILPNEFGQVSDRDGGGRRPTFDLISSDENSISPENELNETFPIEFAINELQHEQQGQQMQGSTENNANGETSIVDDKVTSAVAGAAVARIVEDNYSLLVPT